MEGGLSRANDLRIGKGWWLRVLSSLVVLFLLSPLLLLMFFSFNASRNITSWSGFTLDWYAVAFSDRALWIAVRNSLIIAVASTAASTVLGTLAALALGKYSFRGRALFQSLLHVPIIIPEIIFGISLLALFVFIRMPLGIVSIICAHITFSISFVTLIVLAKVRNFDRNLENACLDLGATRLQAFFHVVLPAISPGIIAGALFAFTLSLDDFVVTFFTAGPGSSTLPLKIYSLIKFGITPAVNAVSTILIVLTASTIIAATLIQTGAQTSRAIRLFSYVLLGVIGIALCAFTLFSPREERVVRLYIFAEYIDQSILTDFQKTYGVKVTQDYTNSNEELLSKLQMGATGYDIIVPTGFMVQIMIREGLIAPLNPRNIPNLEHIDPTFRKLWYDPDGRYSGGPLGPLAQFILEPAWLQDGHLLGVGRIVLDLDLVACAWYGDARDHGLGGKVERRPGCRSHFHLHQNHRVHIDSGASVLYHDDFRSCFQPVLREPLLLLETVQGCLALVHGAVHLVNKILAHEGFR